ncbi:MAG: hypothetical protein F6K32_23585, partial [Desertifilum sp. SIO1I2]|nr:hypothetical protein [Desertifilum sp. SIO1I2]
MFKASNRHNPCPVCGDITGNCRHTDSDLILCMTYPDGGDNPGWQFLKPTSNGLWGLWKPVTEQPQTYIKPVAPKVERIYSTLTHEERDRYIRSFHRNLGLRTADRQRLKARGLSDSEIDAGLFFSLDPEVELDPYFPHVPDNFPGVFRRGGQKILRSHRGIAVPVFDVQGLAIGLQIRLESPGEGGKYRWLKNSHLSNGELPLTVAYPGDFQNPAILLTEGILKPFVAAQKHGAIAIGASGGNFSTSPEQLQTALNAFNAKRVLLCPDGGSVQNRHVFRQYLRLKHLLDRFNVHLEVLWWGQTEKTHPDIDELESLGLAQAIAWEEFATIAATYGVKVELAQPNQRFSQTRSYQNTLQLIHRYAGELKQALSAQPSQNAQVSQAVVPYQHPTVQFIEYHKVGDLPTVEQWQQLGYPEICFAPGRRLDLYSEAICKGFKYLQDASTTGCGKSYDAGRLTGQLLHLEEHQKIFLLANNHRNPTTVTIEDNFADQVVRHKGLSEDPSHRTAKGYAHLKLAKPGELPKIAANCIKPEVFYTLAKSGVALSPGSDNPVCQSCLNLEQCKVSGFLGQKRELYANHNRIRSSIDSVSPSDSVLIVDDSVSEIRTNKTFEVEQFQVDRTYRLVSEQFPQHREVVLPLLRSLNGLALQQTIER